MKNDPKEGAVGRQLLDGKFWRFDGLEESDVMLFAG